MSSYEQRVQPWDKQYQYLLFAAEPYEIIAFKVPSTEIDKVASKSLQVWGMALQPKSWTSSPGVSDGNTTCLHPQYGSAANDPSHTFSSLLLVHLIGTQLS